MEEKPLGPGAPEIEITTEFDLAISRLKWKIFRILGGCLLAFLAVEFFLIFFVFSDSNVLRMQSYNGAIVMAGGLTMVTITSLLLILPTKLIAYESLKLVRASSKDMKDFVDKAGPVVDKVDEVANKLNGQAGKLDQLTLDLKDESRMIREELGKLSKAFSTKIESAAPKKITPARLPMPEESNVESESAEAKGNGHPR